MATATLACSRFSVVGEKGRAREKNEGGPESLEQATATETIASPNKRLNEQNNSHARAY